MTTDFRALCSELVDIIRAHANPDDYAVGYVAEVLARADAALGKDEPAVPEGREPVAVTGQPSDEELLDLHDWMADEWAANHDFELPPSQYARAVLARWGNPAPPVDGEVAELVAWLRRIGPCNDEEAANLLRAAELLQRQALVPVSVSERLPGPEDCDAEGRCWLYYMTMRKVGQWSLRVRSEILEAQYSHWLPTPAAVLPLPEMGE